jgi:uncharacterized protein (TIGR00369 family)
MRDQQHLDRLKTVYEKAPCNAYYEPVIEIARGQSEVRFPVREAFFQGLGAVHGSVYFKAMDDAAYFAAQSLVKDYFLVTVSFNIYFERPIKSGEMIAMGQVVHRTRRVWIAEAVLTDSRGRETARGSGTFMKSQVELPGGGIDG